MSKTLPPAIAVRDAVAADLDTIVGFNLGLATETENKTLPLETLRNGVARALEDPERLRYWVAVAPESGQVIGQAAITREWSDWRNGWIWWFQSVYVHADHRSRGVFRALHGHIRNLARSTPDVIGLRLYVEVENHRAQKTYQALGLTPGGYDVYEELWIPTSTT